MKSLVRPHPFIALADTWSEAKHIMFSMHPTTTPLPQNAAVHVRLRWHKGLLGLPVLTPAVVVDNRRPRS